MTVCLIACCGRKLSDPAPARRLYVSPLFRKCVAWAENRGVEWAVLSAMHGLVRADQVLTPYDRTLSGMTRAERVEWADRTNQQLRTTFPKSDFVVLAGKYYRAAVAGLQYTAPMAGLGIGRQLQWLTERLA